MDSNRFMLSRTLVALLLPACAWHSNAVANVVEPYVTSGLTYSTNIERRSNGNSAFVFDVGAGLDFDYNTAKNSLTGNYEIKQFLYSDDSDKNSAYQDLDANWLYYTQLDGLNVFANASIDNTARFSDQNAITDVLTGNTVQQIDLEGGLQYSNPIQGTALLNSKTYYRFSDDSDNVLNNTGYGIDLYSEDGLDADYLFWQSDWSYDLRTGKITGLSSHYYVFKQSLGVQTPWDIAPLVRVNYEKIIDEQDQSVETLYYGAGVRYQPNKYNFLELSYNIADDEENEDYWGGSIRLQPTQNARFDATYDKRFFGDAYSVQLSHRAKRLTNTLTYDESPVNYDRDSFTSNQNESAIQLTKAVRWNVGLNGRRTTWNLYIAHTDKQAIEALLLDLQGNDVSFGYGASVSHQLSRRTSGVLSVDFDDNDFYELLGDEVTQDDFYQQYKATLNHQIFRQLSSKYELSYTNRSSNNSSLEYDDLRASVELKMDF